MQCAAGHKRFGWSIVSPSSQIRNPILRPPTFQKPNAYKSGVYSRLHFAYKVGFNSVGQGVARVAGNHNHKKSSLHTTPLIPDA